MADWQVGDHIEYYAIGNGGDGNERSRTTGVIMEIITETGPAGDTGYTVNASEAQPRYVIQNDRTGRQAAYKRHNIITRIA